MTTSSSIHLSGIGASGGFALGYAVRLKTSDTTPTAAWTVGTPAEEINRLSHALSQAARELGVLREKTCERLGEAKAEIFDVHLSFLGDPEFIGTAHTLIERSSLSASDALLQASQRFIETLEGSRDDTLKSRAIDLRDVTQRVLARLTGTPSTSSQTFDTDVILVAHDLSPSETAQLDVAHVRGFVTVAGTVNSHSAILARALRLPGVISVADAFAAIPDGTPLIVNGSTGKLILHPTPQETAEARQNQAGILVEEASLLRFAGLPSRTADDHPIALSATIGQLHEVDSALRNGAEGIGLFRSEFSFLNRPALPTEEELVQLYRSVLTQMAPHPVIIRTIDIGGDKHLPTLDLPKEENPFLGIRGLRFCFAHESLFRMQLRALLRASVHGRLKIMLPMVTVLNEVHTVRAWLREERATLEAANEPVASEIELGVMIEVPAAALMADQLAAHVDFFSIGTNDLVQYTMAADRMNARLAHLHAAHHPAVLKLIKLTVDAAHRHGKSVGLCGEMGSDNVMLPLLAGLGLDEISLPSAALTRTRAELSRLDHAAAVKLAAHCLTLGSAAEVSEAVTAFRF